MYYPNKKFYLIKMRNFFFQILRKIGLKIKISLDGEIEIDQLQLKKLF